MPKLPHTSASVVIKTLERMGFAAVRQRGSHIVMRRGSDGCKSPNHKEIAVGTLSGILKQANVSVEEFLEHMS